MQVKEVLERKGHEFWSVTPDTTVEAAVRMMVDKGVGSVLVLDGDEVRGIVTERDLLHKVALEGSLSPEMPVTAVMTTQVLCTRPEQTIEQAMALMTDKRVRHLPVLDNGRIVGLVSIGDLVKSVISEQRFIINQLESYINS